MVSGGKDDVHDTSDSIEKARFGHNSHHEVVLCMRGDVVLPKGALVPEYFDADSDCARCVASDRKAIIRDHKSADGLLILEEGCASEISSDRDANK